MQALIENENRRAPKWMSPMMAFSRQKNKKKISICQFVCVFFTHQLVLFIYFFHRVLPFRDRLASSLFAQFAVSLANNTGAERVTL